MPRNRRDSAVPNTYDGVTVVRLLPPHLDARASREPIIGPPSAAVPFNWAAAAYMQQSPLHTHKNHGLNGS